MKRLATGWLAGVFALFFVASAFAQVAQSPGARTSLFSGRGGLESRVTLGVPAPRGAVRQREVSVNVSGLEAVGGALQARPNLTAVMELPFFADRNFAVTIDRSERTSRGTTVLTGRIEDIPHSSATLVISNGVVSGTIQASGNTYEVAYIGAGRYQVVEIDRSQIQDEPEGLVLTPPPGGMTFSAPQVGADDGSLVDVLVVYTAPARAAASPGNPSDSAAILSRIDMAIAATNLAYANSGVVQRLRLVQAAEVTYAESGDMMIDLQRLSNKNSSGVGIPPDGFLDEVQGLRDAFGADLVSLWVHNTGTGGFVGLGWIMDPVNAGFESYGYNVVRWDTASSNQTFAHELGHNMGLRHDAFMDSVPTPFTYAHGYVDLTNRFRTIMAYNNQCASTPPNTSCTRIDNFSSPTHTFGGAPTGNATNADAAHALNNTGPTVANFRTAVPSGGLLSMRLNTVNTNEGAGTVNIAVARLGGTAGPAQVSYTFADGSGVSGVDYSGTPGVLTWADGDSADKNITATILQDSVPDGQRTFGVTLSGATGAALGSASTATVVIADDEPDAFPVSCAAPSGWSTPAGATTGWSVTTDTAYEGSCSLKSNALTSPPTSEPGCTVAPVVRRTAQTQFTGQFLAGNITFAARTSSEPGFDCLRFTVDGVQQNIGSCAGAGGFGQTPVDPAVDTGWQTFSIPVSPGTRTLRFSYEIDCFVGGLNTAFVDNLAMPLDPATVPTLSFASPTYTYTEGGASVVMTVNRSGPSTGAISVIWTTANGTAIAGQDFGSNGNPAQKTGVLSWAAGDGTPKTITLGTNALGMIDDALFESDETFTIELTAPTGGAVLGANPVTTVTILDNESTFNFADATLTVEENGGNATLAVTRTGALVSTANVTYTTSNGTALVGTDFGTAGSGVQPTGVLSFGVGVASRTVSIPIINDAAVEGPKSFNVTLSAPTGGGQLGTTTASQITINSDDRGIAMGASTLSTAESAGTVLVQVNRSGAATGSMSVNYAFTNGTALNGTHFNGTPGTLTWADGDVTPKTISVGIVDNAAVNANRTFTVTLSGPVNAVLGTPASTTVTVVDDDNTLQFSAATFSGSEGSASVALTVTRMGGVGGSASINWSTTNGTAVAGQDFGVSGNPADLSGVLNWAAGDAATKTITIPILPDLLIEGNETFTVNLAGASGTGTSMGTIASATVTISDDDSGITFASPTYSVIESGPVVSVQVQRIGNTAAAIGVTWTTANGTAIAGQDFGTGGNPAQRTGTLAWAAGDASAKTLTVGVGGTLPVINDTTSESSEDFTITLSAPTGGAALGPTPTTTVTIVDDESTFAFSQPTITVSEAGPNVTLNVLRTGSLATVATVTYATVAGTATSPADYATATGVLSFGVGESVKTIAIGPVAAAAPYVGIVNDTLIEGLETFQIALSAPTGGGQLLGGVQAALVTIDSDDRGLSMAAPTLTVPEDGASAAIQVTRSGSSTGSMSVNYTFTNATALNGTHYTGTPGTLTWADGDIAAKTITVPIADDTAVNANRTFTVALSGPSGATLGAPTSTVVTIADNDNTLQFSAATFAGTESSPAVTLTVTRVGGAAGAASVTWTTVNGTALSGADFGTIGQSAAVTGTLTWAAGDAAAKTITIPLLNDALIEGAETFTVQLSAPTGTGTSIGSQSSALVTINDEDSGVSFASATQTVIEGGPAISVTVNRIGNPTSAISVTWTTANGTAVAGQDFGSSPAQLTGVLSWRANDVAPKTILVGTGGTIPVVNDTVFEPNEDFTITLSAPTGGAALGPTPTTTVTIVDNESNFQFSQPTLTVAEAGPNATLTVTRTGSTALAQTVTYATAPGSATATADYTAATGVISFAAGETSKTITIGPVAAAAPYIAVVNDTLIEPPETFTVTLSAPTAGGVLGTPAAATITIESDDRGVTMAAATRSVPENAGTIDILVSRAGPPTGTVDVNYAFTNGTALGGTHYTATPGTLHWVDGDAASKAVTVAIANDALVNTSRTFTMTLSGAVGATLGAPASTVVTIADDDNTLQFSAPTASAAEGTPTLTLSVTRLGGPANPASVTWTTADGSALAGTDFGTLGNTAAVTGTLTWGAGDAATKTFTVPILNDSIVEGAKTFTVNLSAPSGATLGTTPTATVTLSDNDSGVVFAVATYTIAETAGNVVLTVNRIGPATSAATVMWATANVTAIAGQDFGTNGNPAQRSGTLSWAAGDAAARTITIPILNDGITDAGDETFTVTLSGPTGGIVLGTPSVATVTILDDDIAPETELTFSQPKYLVLENAGNVLLSVNRAALPTFDFTRAATVNYATQPGTALVGSDYTARTGTLTWAAGDSAAKTITVPIANDAIAESAESFTVVLSAVTPGTRIGTAQATVTVLDDDEVFPPQGAVPVTWSVPVGANAGWLVANDPGPYEGVFALRNEMIGDNETAQVEVTGTFTAAGTVTFRVRVSTEAGFDFLRFYVDGVKAGEWSGTANTAWQVFSSPLSAGPHTLRWSYEKDGNLSAGQDAVFLDAVTMPAFTP